MIQYHEKNRTWTWSKWDYLEQEGKKKVVRCSGTLRFQKIFQAVFEGGEEPVNARNSKDLKKTLKKNGVDFIFLYQGETKVETQFKTVEEAEKYYRLDVYPHWDLTDYWFGYNRKINSWAMYDAFTGTLQFTPQSLLAQRAQRAHYPPRPTIHQQIRQKNISSTFH
jgi:hypothetical protein